MKPDDRDAAELALRDAYAAGCNAIEGGRIRSYVTAAEYAKTNAPKLRDALSAKPEGEAVAWIRFHQSHTDTGIKYWEELVAGRDRPPGDEWIPLCLPRWGR